MEPLTVQGVGFLKKWHACLQVYEESTVLESTVLERNKENVSVIDTAGQPTSTLHVRSREM